MRLRGFGHTSRPVEAAKTRLIASSVVQTWSSPFKTSLRIQPAYLRNLHRRAPKSPRSISYRSGKTSLGWGVGYVPRLSRVRHR